MPRINAAQDNILFLKSIERKLAASRIPAARHEAESIVTHFGLASRLDFFTGEKSLTVRAKKAIRVALQSRLRGAPLQYVIKTADFYGRKFFVTKDTLIPRPETELLVEEAIKILVDKYGCHSRNVFSGNQSFDPRLRGDDNNVSPRILDMGTGSGCIAVSLTLAILDCKITALDISEAALKIARKNADFHKMGGRIKFLKSDLFSGFNSGHEDFWDMIVSNPPYIPEKDIPGLPREVRREPFAALNGGLKGLEIICAILERSPNFLKKGGWLIMEIGKGQSGFLSKKIRLEAVFKNLRFVKDFNGIDRILVAQNG